MLPVGKASEQTKNLLHSPKLVELLKTFEEDYDIVLIDTAPALHMRDARLLGSLADGVVLIVRAGHTSRDAASAVIDKFRQDGTPVLGVILNDWKPESQRSGLRQGIHEWLSPLLRAMSRRASGLRQAVILAGGRGERMRPLTDDRPKPMIEFHGRPFLAYMIEMLRDAGFESVLLLLGYRADVIQDYFGDGSRFGIDIEYSVSAAEDLTVRRVQLARDRIESTFMLLYCDNYWPMRIDHMWSHYRAVGKPAMITVYRNADGYTKDSVKVHPCGNVEIFDRSRTKPGLKGVEISYAILTRAVLDLLPEEDALFEEAVYPRLVETGQLSAYVTDHRYYSVGSLQAAAVDG